MSRKGFDKLGFVFSFFFFAPIAPRLGTGEDFSNDPGSGGKWRDYGRFVMDGLPERTFQAWNGVARRQATCRPRCAREIPPGFGLRRGHAALAHFPPNPHELKNIHAAIFAETGGEFPLHRTLDTFFFRGQGQNPRAINNENEINPATIRGCPLNDDL